VNCFEALGLARIGAMAASETALSTARDQMQMLDEAYQSESVFGFSERRWHFYEGRILSYLGRTEEAWFVHDEALALYPDDVVGDPALIQLDRAVSLVRGCQVAAGCELATRTLIDLPLLHRTKLFLRAAQGVLAVVPAAQRQASNVRTLRETVRACATVV